MDDKALKSSEEDEVMLSQRWLGMTSALLLRGRQIKKKRNHQRAIAKLIRDAKHRFLIQIHSYT